MAPLYDILPPAEQWRLAVQVKSPAQLARTFASFVGQFYDRSDFDALACAVEKLYEAQSAQQATTFRTRLDRRLYDRFHPPVEWSSRSQRPERRHG